MLETDPRAFCKPGKSSALTCSPVEKWRYSMQAVTLVTKWGMVFGKVLAAMRRIKTSRATFWTERGVTDFSRNFYHHWE